MSGYLSPEVRERAHRLLRTRSTLVGERYWGSELKKRIDRYFVAPGALLLSSPVIAVTSLAVWVDEGWPPIIALEIKRPDEGDIPLFKIRTMVNGAQKDELEVTGGGELGQFKINRSDRRITRTGRWIRRTSLDELPQLANVVLGHLSMVGTRPPGRSDWEIVNRNIGDPVFGEYRGWIRKGLPYGLTGMYGIFGRARLTMGERAELDNIYAREASFAGDLKIMALTIPAILSRRGAY